MKKLLIASAAIMLAVPAQALAQSPSVGIMGGLNRADLGGSRIVTSEARTGFTVGAFLTFPIIGPLAVQPEVTYTRKGAHSAAYDYDAFPQDADAPPLGVYLTEQTTHDYIEVPVLLKLMPASSDGVRPVFFAGPSIAFLVATEKVHDIDYAEHMNSTDVGLMIGGGVDFSRFSLDARYTFGLSAIDKDFDGLVGHVHGDVKNRALSVTAGFRLF